MMNVKNSNNFNVYKIHVVDVENNEFSKIDQLKSYDLYFETKEEMMKRWQELIRENHYSLDMLNQEIFIAFAFHS